MSETFDCNKEMQVVESRKKALEYSEKREKEKKEKEIAAANNIVNLVCNVFKASDKPEQGKLVWHVRLMSYYSDKKNCRRIRCWVCFTEDLTEFYGVNDKDDVRYLKQYEEVLGAIKVVNAIETTEDIFNKAINYFKCMPNFKVAELACDSDIVTITLKSDNL